MENLEKSYWRNDSILILLKKEKKKKESELPKLILNLELNECSELSEYSQRMNSFLHFETRWKDDFSQKESIHFICPDGEFN